MSTYSHLTAEDRDRIASLMADGLSLRAIAKSLGRSASTISRELRRTRSTAGRICRRRRSDHCNRSSWRHRTEYRQRQRICGAFHRQSIRSIGLSAPCGEGKGASFRPLRFLKILMPTAPVSVAPPARTKSQPRASRGKGSRRTPSSSTYDPWAAYPAHNTNPIASRARENRVGLVMVAPPSGPAQVSVAD